MTEQVTAAPGAIRVEFVPTVNDQVRAHREIVRSGGWSQVGGPLYLAGCAVFLAVQAWLYGWSVLFGNMKLVTFTWVGLLVLQAAVPLLTRWGIVRQRRQNPNLAGPMSLTFSDAGVHVESPLGMARMPWASFVRARETPEMLLFHFSKKAAYFVPRRALRETDEARLRALVASHLGARAELTKPTDG